MTGDVRITEIESRNAAVLAAAQALATARGSKVVIGEPDAIELTQAEASDFQQYRKALEQVGGDHSKVKVQGVNA